ncbi:MAG: ABC transporter permease [Candidatus Hadarchaeum sp.]|uniref:ABC transporter permease n=1 Tax=Candidatus Hadarchaeum sp. TaxID=2883567 RepID=UPI003172C420
MWPFIARCLEVATILLFASIGELLDQRSGILNVGLEGLMLLGASSGFLTATATGNIGYGFVAGLITGCIFGFLHGLFSIKLKVNQVVSGMGIWVFAMGFVTFVTDKYSGPLSLSSPRIAGLLSPLFFVALALVFVVWFILYKTHLGLKIRSVGEDPAVAEATGINVAKIRYLCVTIGGLLGGFAGAFLSLNYLGLWGHLPTQGLGWIALALINFSMWRPTILLAGSLLFGVVWQFSISPELIVPGLGLPLAVYRMLPFMATIIVLIVISTPRFRRKWGLTRPAALGLPYLKD